MSQLEAARAFGVSRRSVGVWVRALQADGPQALEARRRGRRPGEPSALTRRQQAELLADLVAGYPDDHGTPARLWSRRALALHIEHRWGRRLAVSTVGNYLVRWGLVELPAWAPPRTGPPADPCPWVEGGRDNGGWRASLVQVVWRRSYPRFLDTALLPEPGSFAAGPVPGQIGPPREYVDTLVAHTGRGDVLFRCLKSPYSAAAIAGFGARLAEESRYPLIVQVRQWPTREIALLRAWHEYPGRALEVVAC
jgi:transposase